MESSRQPRSVKVLACKRRQIKGTVQRMLTRLTELEENQQLSSIPEIRVFAKNIQKIYGEFDLVLREMEESDPFADERDAHDLECAEIEGLLQGVSQRTVSLNSALLSQPVPTTVPEQFQVQPLAVSPQEDDPTPLSTTKTRGEGECAGDGDVPEEASAKRGEPAETAEVDAKVCAQFQPISSPSISTKGCDEPFCTLCNGWHLNVDFFTQRGEPVGQIQETNPSLNHPQSMSERYQRSESPLEMHHAMQPPTEPDAVQLESPPEERNDESVPNAVSTSRTEEPADGEFNVGRRQSVELGSLLPADIERDDADSDDPEAPKQETAELVVMDEQARSLQPTDSEDRSLPSGAQTVCTAPTIQENPAKKPSHEAKGAVEKLQKPVISSNITKKVRLVWDPGV